MADDARSKGREKILCAMHLRFLFVASHLGVSGLARKREEEGVGTSDEARAAKETKDLCSAGRLRL